MKLLNESIFCINCKSDSLTLKNKLLYCNDCDNTREVWDDRILLNHRLEEDYGKIYDNKKYVYGTKHRYQNDNYAENYLKQYTQLQ